MKVFNSNEELRYAVKNYESEEIVGLYGIISKWILVVYMI